MSLSTHYLEYGCHVVGLCRRCRRRRRAYAPTSNTPSYDNHEKINPWASFCFPYEYGAPLLSLHTRQVQSVRLGLILIFVAYFYPPSPARMG